MNEQSGWSSYEKLVMDKLETLEEDIVALNEQVTLMRIDIAQLKIKAGIWGGVAGMVPAVVGVLAIFAGVH